MAGPQYHNEEHDGPIERLRLTLNRFERHVFKILTKAGYSISLTESSSICYGVEGDVWFWHLDYSDKDLIRIGREVEQSTSSADQKNQELIAVARISQLLPGLWQELSQPSPSWKFAQLVGLLSSNVPYPGARKRLTREFDNQKRSSGGKTTAKLRKETSDANKASILAEATKLMKAGREPRNIAAILRERNTWSESTIRRALPAHESGNWNKAKRNTTKR